MLYFDTHNHLQDERLTPLLGTVLEGMTCEQIGAAVVNGSGEDDWEAVYQLALKEPRLIPSFGCHPWYLRDASPEWKTRLIAYLDSIPSAVGEIGLDRWIENPDTDLQERFFNEQLEIAAWRNLPVSIHCLQAWGPLLQLLENNERPSCGFLLHSYGGSAELLKPLVRLGAYISFPGYFLAGNKEKKRAVFRDVPRDRLLIETDAPDQCLPAELDRFSCVERDSGARINHPFNIAPIYRELAAYLGEDLEQLAQQVEDNFRRLFGGVLSRRSSSRS